ncbi:MAG: ribose 5-phosphate isomerase B [Candidatus Diapherotrites archaeon]|nr:ribose 5-phosphate isomerase B [Candidatus Diapherotrites archaeon]
MKKVFIASDHGGFELKEFLQKKLVKKGFTLIDLGTHSNESVDYPDYAKKIAGKILKEKNSIGILICGTGIGMSISANRFKGIRAALCWNSKTAKLARNHNNANVLCLGARVLKKRDALRIANVFLKENPSKEERHKRRVKKIDLCK